jgi:hypothetical protein
VFIYKYIYIEIISIKLLGWNYSTQKAIKNLKRSLIRA